MDGVVTHEQVDGHAQASRSNWLEMKCHIWTTVQDEHKQFSYVTSIQARSRSRGNTDCDTYMYKYYIKQGIQFQLASSPLDSSNVPEVRKMTMNINSHTTPIPTTCLCVWPCAAIFARESLSEASCGTVPSHSECRS